MRVICQIKSKLNQWLDDGHGDSVANSSTRQNRPYEILYLVSKGGAAASGSENAATAMLLVLNNAPPPKVVINELTTVASAFTAARFISGESISGNPLGLRIAAGNVPNLVDPATPDGVSIMRQFQLAGEHI